MKNKRRNSTRPSSSPANSKSAKAKSTKAKSSKKRNAAAATPATSNGAPLDASNTTPWTAAELRRSPLDLTTTLANYTRWQNHLQQRPAITSLRERLPSGKVPQLLWGARCCHVSDADRQRIAAVERVTRRQQVSEEVAAGLAEWLASEAADSADEIGTQLTLLATIQAAPWLCLAWEASAWQQLVELVETECGRGNTGDWEQAPTERLLRAVELPLTWAYCFPEWAENAARLRGSRHLWNEALQELVDGDGSVEAHRHHLLPLWLATWTRSLCLAQQLDHKPFNKDGRLRLEWFTRECLRWCRPDRSLLLSERREAEPAFEKRLLEAAVQLSQDEEDEKIAAFALRLGSASPVVNASTLPESAGHADWGQTGLLRSSWHPKDAIVAIDYSRPELRWELFRHESLSCGALRETVVVDGETIRSSDDWSEICWHVDDDVCYLEIEKPLRDDLRLQRQFLLARQDHFVLFADSVLADRERALDYQLEIPLAAHVSVEFEQETREGWLCSEKHRWRVLPLALPEWRRESCPAELTGQSQELRLNQRVSAERLFVPLFFDLEPRRAKKRGTWRRLTVARDRVIESAEHAVGYRVQLGDSQWMFFRALNEIVPRTVMGAHLNCEFYAGSFRPDTQLEELISVEPE